MKTIRFKSTLENWKKEYLGLKCNTTRIFEKDDKDIRKEVLDDWISFKCKILNIEMENTETNEVFTRLVTDVTWWRGTYIISWYHQF